MLKPAPETTSARPAASAATPLRQAPERGQMRLRDQERGRSRPSGEARPRTYASTRSYSSSDRMRRGAGFAYGVRVPRAPATIRAIATRPSTAPGIARPQPRPPISGSFAPTVASTRRRGSRRRSSSRRSSRPRGPSSRGRGRRSRWRPRTSARRVRGAALAGAARGVERERVEVEVGDLVVGDAVEVGVDVARGGDADEGAGPSGSMRRRPRRSEAASQSRHAAADVEAVGRQRARGRRVGVADDV